jgi:hypothetical protein
MTQDTAYLISLVEKCREENEIGQRIAILEFINCLLPTDAKLIIPSLITNSCVDNLLSALEVRLLPPVYTHL